MSFLDSIVDDMNSMRDGSWKEKVVPKRKEPPKPTFEEDDTREKDLERFEKRRRIEKQKQEEEETKRIREDGTKRKGTNNKEVLEEMARMFGRKSSLPLKKKKDQLILEIDRLLIMLQNVK